MALNTRIQTRRDTAANWEAKNPVLLDGEMIIVTTNAGDIRFKIGDGTKTYTQLPFQDETLYNALSGKANASELEALQTEVDGKSDSGHTHSNYASTVTTTGSGNAVTAVTQSGNTITVTKGTTFLTSVPSEYVTETELTAKGYLTAVPSEYVTETELTAKGYATTSALSELQTEVDGKSDSDHTHSNVTPITTAGDGAAYTATVPDITALTAGVSFTMIPHTASTSQTATLNVNSLGAKALRRPLSVNNTTTVAPSMTNWLYASKPVRVMYNGTYWIVMDMPRPNAPDIYGTVAIANGGTDATDAATARANLDVYSKAEIDDIIGDVEAALAAI